MVQKGVFFNPMSSECRNFFKLFIKEKKMRETDFYKKKTFCSSLRKLQMTKEDVEIHGA
jgi:hypothetical protein